MRVLLTRAIGFGLVGAVAACGGGGVDDVVPAVVPLDPVARVQAWRDKHEADYLYEFVSIVGLHSLAAGTHTLGSDRANDIVVAAVPPTVGRVTVSDGTVRFEPEPGLAALQAEERVNGPVVLKEPGEDAADAIAIGDVRFKVHVTGERLFLRVWDPNGELAAGFLGFSWFPIQDSYRVTARFIPDAEPREMPVLNTYNDIVTYTTEGVVEFELHGQTLRLRPFTTRPNRFYFVFRDASGGEETYETARFLYTDLLEDGTTVLDFNEAYNPPCAFNVYTTCPIPLRENILPVKVLAGEKAYPVEVRLPGGG
jgi:uncharacterized protein (DUF1684 family)